jgi:hypothetical protein
VVTTSVKDEVIPMQGMSPFASDSEASISNKYARLSLLPVDSNGREDMNNDSELRVRPREDLSGHCDSSY